MLLGGWYNCSNMNPITRYEPGMGVHQVAPGQSSEPCILLSLHRLLSSYGLPAFWKLWTEIYPNEPLSYDEARLIVATGLDYTTWPDLHDYNIRRNIIEDVARMGREALALRVQDLFDELGVLV